VDAGRGRGRSLCPNRPDSSAYVAEPEVTRTFEEELALDHPDLWDRVRGTVGDHRILSLRYRDPGLVDRGVNS